MLFAALSSVLVQTAACAQAQDLPTDHTPPAAPQQSMPEMSAAQMKSIMDMDDSASVAMFKLDEFERGNSSDAYSSAWNAEAWYGGDLEKFWLRSEGAREFAATDARIEAFWDHAFASYWDWQLGARRDFGDAPHMARPERNWAAFGVNGIAPYWFDIEATAYVADQGRMAARLRSEYDILLSQRWILTPELELNLYSKADRARAVASGLADAEFGLRLRYEIERKFAPYVGVVWNYRRANGNEAVSADARAGTDRRLVIGLRLWL